MLYDKWEMVELSIYRKQSLTSSSMGGEKSAKSKGEPFEMGLGEEMGPDSPGNEWQIIQKFGSLSWLQWEAIQMFHLVGNVEF